MRKTMTDLRLIRKRSLKTLIDVSTETGYATSTIQRYETGTLPEHSTAREDLDSYYEKLKEAL